MTEEERDEFEVQDELREKRRKIECLDDLFELIRDVKDNYNTGYGVAPRAIAQAAVATANYLLDEMGCTGFQTNYCVRDIVKDLIYIDNKAGFRLIDYDNLLYPQYEDKFHEKTISKGQWEILQHEAQKGLDDCRLVSTAVLAHWQSIVDGNVPFGFNIKEW